MKYAFIAQNEYTCIDTVYAENDPAYGWNGNINGTHGEMGTYVYFAIILFNDGSQRELYRRFD
jgi:hypothetical protein